MNMVGKTRRSLLWASLFCSSALLLLVGAALEPDSRPAAGAPSTAPALARQTIGYEKAIIIPIQDTITDITKDSLARRLDYAREKKYELVIFELDTPGGALGTTLEICDAIKALRDEGIKTYAWVNNEAYSAGTIIALATDGIVMSANATIGDCQPIMITELGVSAVPKEVEAKATSPLIAELEDSARRNHYNYDMVLAFVRPEMQMFWLVNTQTGEKRFVDTYMRDQLFGLSAGGGGLLRLFGKSEGGKGEDRHEPVPESLSKTAWRYVNYAPEIGEVRQPVDTDRDLLTLRTDKATAFGFCLAAINNESDLRSYFNVTGPVERMEYTWLEKVVEWLASPLVRGILFMLMLLGAYAEFQAPGFGLPGTVAVLALILFLGAPYLAGLTVTWEILAVLLGFALLAVEIFVIPGFGVAGILGLGLIMIGLMASFVPAEPSYPQQDWFHLPTVPDTYIYLRHGLYSLACGLCASLAGMFLLTRYFPQTAVGRIFVPPNPRREQLAIGDPYGGAANVGEVGTAESVLRPAGKARFGDLLVDVVTQGDFIDKGARIQVLERHGNRVVVVRKE